MATSKKKTGYGSSSPCLDGKPQVNGQPADLRTKLMAAYKAMEYGGGTKNSNDAKAPVYPTKAGKKAK
jgi:hypothetical protein